MKKADIQAENIRLKDRIGELEEEILDLKNRNAILQNTVDESFKKWDHLIQGKNLSREE